ncbi:hypothetical protein LCGC14_1750640 [marine sediment metagenome]|uniref:Uncharacterized protein n=1 Tax=marine sediment metagenome TaxID=412755 RepID=A0A0F9HRD3_9ZZZZ
MADTLGDLIDKLTIVNLRCWHLLAVEGEENTKSDDKDKKYSDIVASVNKERNSLIDQINAALRVLIDKAASQDSTFNLTADELLGTGKNKFYKKGT